MLKKRFHGSLVARIASIWIALVVLPLVFYTFFLGDKEKRLQREALSLELELAAEATLKLFNGWKEYASLALKYFDDSPPPFSSFLTFNREHICTYATDRSLLGRKDLFTSEVKRAFLLGEVAFIAPSLDGKKTLFLFKRFGETVVGGAQEVNSWLSQFTLTGDRRSPFTYSLVFSPDTNFKREAERDSFHLPLPMALFSLEIRGGDKEVGQIGGSSILMHLLLLMASLLLFGGMGAYFLVKILSKPLDYLQQVMASVAEGKEGSRYQFHRFGFELNELGEGFNHTLDALLSHRAEAEKQQLAKELLAQELAIGRSVQQGLIPLSLDVQFGLKMSGQWIPAREVGGDFYDLFPIDSNHLFIAIVDGSDKGISACLSALAVRSLLRSQALSSLAIEEILEKVNAIFAFDVGASGNFVTAWIAIYERDTKRLTYSSAGHPPPILIGPFSPIQELSTGGVALGVVDQMGCRAESLILSEGALLLLYTDGVTEAQSTTGELFGTSRLFQLVEEHRGAEPEEIKKVLTKEIAQFSASTPQHDDLTFLLLKLPSCS